MLVTAHRLVYRDPFIPPMGIRVVRFLQRLAALLGLAGSLGILAFASGLLGKAVEARWGAAAQTWLAGQPWAVVLAVAAALAAAIYLLKWLRDRIKDS